jgi:hypothetical protein
MKLWLKEIEHSFNKSKKSKNKTIYKVNISQPVPTSYIMWDK